MTTHELTRLYRLIRPGERFTALAVTVVGGRRSVRLVLVRDGVRRVVDVQDAARWLRAAARRRHAAVRAARAFVHRLIVSRT
jgi:hypothetical protein